MYKLLVLVRNAKNQTESFLNLAYQILKVTCVLDINEYFNLLYFMNICDHHKICI